MKKLIFLFAIFICNFSFSQVSLSGNKLVKDGQSYKFSEYKQVLTNTEAQNYFAKARTNNTVGQVFATAGGFSIGWGLGMLISKNSNPDVRKGRPTPFFLVGAGLIGIGIPFAISAKKNAEKAIAIENGSSTAFQPYFKLESAGNGIALSYNF